MPPTPSEALNSLIRTPFTGNGSWFLAEANAGPRGGARRRDLQQITDAALETKVDPAIRRFFFVTGAFSGVPSGAVEIVAELGDEFLDIVRLAPELGGALTLGRDHAFRLGLLFLALIDQRGQPLAVIGECCEIALEAGALGGDAGA